MTPSLTKRWSDHGSAGRGSSPVSSTKTGNEPRPASASERLHHASEKLREQIKQIGQRVVAEYPEAPRILAEGSSQTTTPHE